MLSFITPAPWPTTAIWAIAIATIAAVLIRPWKLPEAVFATAGAVLLVALGLLAPGLAWKAIGKGLDVYLFLAGMMLISETARREGVFDWCAAIAVDHARRSPARLFWLIYGVGIVVTVFLSNDATAVVLTPAVFAATRAARVRKPLPYLCACAFVANAASFVLPISNPANLVVFEDHMPSLVEWFRHFALPSVLSIAVTGGALYWVCRRDLVEEVETPTETPRLSFNGRLTVGGIGVAILALLSASALRIELGAPTLAVALALLGIIALREKQALREIPTRVSWSVLPLVAGLFEVVEAVNRAGALEASKAALAALSRWPALPGALAGAFGITALSNVVNNLPSGLVAGGAIHASVIPDSLRDALLIGVDLGPNLSVTGSLATILWLIVLRREGQEVSAWSFLKMGMVVAPLALLASVLSSVMLAH